MGRRSAYEHKIAPETETVQHAAKPAKPAAIKTASNTSIRQISTETLQGAAKSLTKLVVPVTPWGEDLDAMRLQLDRSSSLMRTQVYSLSKALGSLAAELKLQEAVERLREWEEAPHREGKAAIEREMAHEGSLLVTDMSGFTRITREEGILHFLMLIKQMQSVKSRARAQARTRKPWIAIIPRPLLTPRVSCSCSF